MAPVRVSVFVFIAGVLLAGLWSLLRPLPPQTVAPQAPATTTVAVADSSAPAVAAEVAPTTPMPSSAPVPEPQRLRIDVAPPAGAAPAVSVLRVLAGEAVELTVVSARDDELHLHGYDLTLDLRAGEPGTLRFVAEHAGRFEIELHRGHAQIGVLEVLPR